MFKITIKHNLWLLFVSASTKTACGWTKWRIFLNGPTNLLQPGFWRWESSSIRIQGPDDCKSYYGRTSMSRILISLFVGFSLLTFPVWGAWPEKPVKVIVPFKAGGTSDQTARVFQAAMKENNLLSQPVTIVNVGGHYSIGSRQVM